MSRFHPSMAWKQSFHPQENDSQENSPADADGDPPSGLEAGSWTSAGSTASGAEQAGGGNFGTTPDLAPCASIVPAASRAFLLPLHYEANYRYPLVVWLHSDGFNENQVQHVMPHISLRNYVAAGVRGVRAADSVGHRFDWADSAAAAGAAHDAVMQTVDEARERFSVDPSRIFLAGYRSGGSMALRVALREPTRFAGVVSLGGTLPSTGGMFGDLVALRRRQMPMLWQWATASDAYHPERLKGDIRSAMLMQAKVEIRQYDDDDEMNTVTLADVDRWIMRSIGGGGEGAESAHSTTPTQFSSN